MLAAIEAATPCTAHGWIGAPREAARASVSGAPGALSATLRRPRRPSLPRNHHVSARLGPWTPFGTRTTCKLSGNPSKCITQHVTRLMHSERARISGTNEKDVFEIALRVLGAWNRQRMPVACDVAALRRAFPYS